MQRASPTMMTPFLYPGMSGSAAHARPVISAGPSCAHQGVR